MHHHGCTAPSQWLVEDGDVRWPKIGLGTFLENTSTRVHPLIAEIQLGEAGNPPKQVCPKVTYRRVVKSVTDELCPTSARNVRCNEWDTLPCGPVVCTAHAITVMCKS